MDLYRNCIDQTDRLLIGYDCRQLMWKNAEWPDAGHTQMIFTSDTAYELGGGKLPAIGMTLFTDHDQSAEDEVLLVGKDLDRLNSNTPYARIAIVTLHEQANDKGLYERLRKVEYSRYRCSPEGFMMRVSAMNHRESVRISKKSLKQGLGFAEAGRQFIEVFHQCPDVQAVRLIFITDPSFPYEELQNIETSSQKITSALDHLARNIKMDCDTCGLKNICDEVADLCEKDFGKNIRNTH